uniref:Chaperone protein DnaJ n=1 Tax=Lygus hesperus TaxID=30085 RepID=A0A146MC15_LYGHE
MLDVQYSLNDYNEAYCNATGVRRDEEVSAHNITERKGPVHGKDATFMLKLSFDESIHGCTKIICYKKYSRCALCDGSGSAMLQKPRPCPQCCGRGRVVLPSATYYIDKLCTFCLGLGSAPLPSCGVCHGAGLCLDWVQRPVNVPAGLTSMSQFTVSHAGHEGCRGGKTGHLLVTVLIA